MRYGTPSILTDFGLNSLRWNWVIDETDVPCRLQLAARSKTRSAVPVRPATFAVRLFPFALQPSPFGFSPSPCNLRRSPRTVSGNKPDSPLSSPHAGIAQLVEHNLAKVGVAGSSPVSRSRSIRLPAGISAGTSQLHNLRRVLGRERPITRRSGGQHRSV